MDRRRARSRLTCLENRSVHWAARERLVRQMIAALSNIAAAVWLAHFLRIAAAKRPRDAY